MIHRRLEMRDLAAAVLATVVAGCGAPSVASTADGGVHGDDAAAPSVFDGGNSPSPDASSAADAADASPPADGIDAAVACASRDGYFACGANICSRAIQTCSEGQCFAYEWTTTACGACPTCACLEAKSTMILASCVDDGAGGITLAVRPPGKDGDPCKVVQDCAVGFCVSGVCTCTPAGAVANNGPNGTDDCCSGWWLGGTCEALAGSGCTTRVPDCYGGSCAGGKCVCVGSGGYCNADAGCCAGATKCVSERCQ
jgi:hypothetical protein